MNCYTSIRALSRGVGIYEQKITKILLDAGLKIPPHNEIARTWGLSNLGKKESIETRRKKSIANMGHPGWRLGKKDSLEKRIARSEKMRGPNNPMWRGGAVGRVAKYGSGFSWPLRTKVKNFYNNQCFICGNDKPNLDIHHVNFNKNDHSLTNLIPLCKSCHCLTSLDYSGNHNRWKFYFMMDNNHSAYVS